MKKPIDMNLVQLKAENIELKTEIESLKAQIEIMKSCVNCRYCINEEKCPWQPKGCGMKHWELKEIKEK